MITFCEVIAPALIAAVIAAYLGIYVPIRDRKIWRGEIPPDGPTES